MDEATRQKLWKQWYDKLSKAIDIGYTPKADFYDAALVASLKQNLALFSAFKEQSFNSVLLDLLNKGSLPTWNDFKKEAVKTAGLYNGNWLRSEYHQTVATANMTQKWQDFERNAEVYPNLKYVAVIDERTRDQHRAWNGLTAPINHPIWKKIYPPNDWGCRCDVIQTDEPVSKDLSGIKAKAGFNNNPALSGKVFSEIAYANGLTEGQKKNALTLFAAFYDDTPNRLKRYKGIPFKKVKGIENKGVLEVFTKGRQNKKEFVSNKIALTILADKGLKYRLLPIIEDGLSNPDALNLERKWFADIKVATTSNGKNAIQNGLKEASKQGAKEMILHLTVKPDSYKDMYGIVLENIKKNRNKNVRYITIIFPDGNYKTYDLWAIKKKKLK